jgi:hypothetical protein
MQCNEFASVIEQQGLLPLSPAAQDHLAGCVSCQDFLADLSSISALANELPAEAEPPQRVWVSLRAQLEAEGLIKEPAFATREVSAGWMQKLRAWFTLRSLATAGVGLVLAIAAFLQLHKPSAPANPSVPVARQEVKPAIQQQVASAQVAPLEQAPAQHRPASRHSITTPEPSERALAAPPLQVFQADRAGTNPGEPELAGSRLAGNPALDESLQKNLRIVNEFIAECEAHLKKHPQDMLAREYLNSANQQKAQLIAAMLDSGRSEQ